MSYDIYTHVEDVQKRYFRDKTVVELSIDTLVKSLRATQQLDHIEGFLQDIYRIEQAIQTSLYYSYHVRVNELRVQVELERLPFVQIKSRYVSPSSRVSLGAKGD